MSKETMMIVAIAVALFAIFYVHRELQTTKLEVQKLSAPVLAPAPVQPPAPVLAPAKPSKKKESADETLE